MIKFGTDGWRGKIADDLTFENVRIVSQAIMNYIIKSGAKDKGLVVGWDNRFLSKEFALEAAGIAEHNGIKAAVSQSSLPSPVLSFAVKFNGAAGGIMITASHNPAEYNGIKFKADFAGSASPEITAEIEKEISLLDPKRMPKYPSSADIQTSDFMTPYLKNLNKLIDINLLKNSKLRVIVDPMHGSGAGYFTKILSPIGVDVSEVNNDPSPLFGGQAPEPLPKNLDELFSAVKEAGLKYPKDLVVGIALDGDSDRISAVDPSGMFINPHNVFAIMLKHLIEHKKWSGEVVRTFNVTKLIDKLCQKYSLKLNETPIGFKYICDLMLKKDILMGGEESGGMGIKNHIPERDAVVNGLILLEAMAASDMTLSRIMNGFYDEFGPFAYNRNDIHIEREKALNAVSKLKTSPPKSIAGKTIKETLDLDGLKFVFDDESWILFRASGTEPMLRIYAEAKSKDEVELMLAEGENIIKSR